MEILGIGVIAIFCIAAIIALIMFVAMVFDIKSSLSRLKERFDSKISQSQFYCMEQRVEELEEKLRLLATHQDVHFVHNRVSQDRFIIEKINPTNQ